MNKSITDGQIRWKCRRGLLELDLLLRQFCETILPTLSDEKKEQFFYFLDTPDQVMSDWVFAHVMPDDRINLQFVFILRDLGLDKMKKNHENNEKNS
jgi:antitoxin CptB